MAWLLGHRLAIAGALVLLISGTATAIILGIGTHALPRDATLLPTALPFVAPVQPTPRAATAVPATPLAVQPGKPTPVPGLTVYITGAIQRAGVYTLVAAARIADLLTAAGGPAADADLERVNLAALLHDGDHIVVPHRGTPVSGDLAAGAPTAAAVSGGVSAGKAPAGLVDINQADAATLATLSGIGPKLAGRIIAYRQQHGRFARPEAIQDVPGIGPKLFARISAQITVGR